jgi:hypothetical protein
MSANPAATVLSPPLDYTKLERVLSKPRLDSYRHLGQNDRDALCRYLWNVALCESLYSSLQALEVAFRNAVHTELGAAIAVPGWLTSPPGFIYEDEMSAIGKAKRSLRERRGTITEPFLVAEMSFGFWTSLLDSRYDRMWPKIIAAVFPRMPRTVRTRSEASKRMNRVRHLRNSALHHHSIWHWRDLTDQHRDLHTLLDWLCESISMVTKEADRFPQLHCGGPGQFAGLVQRLTSPPAPAQQTATSP